MAGSVDYFSQLGAEGDGWSTTPGSKIKTDGIKALAAVRELVGEGGDPEPWRLGAGSLLLLAGIWILASKVLF